MMGRVVAVEQQDHLFIQVLIEQQTIKGIIMAQYKIFNGPFPTTAAQLAVTTGTSIKTMLQVKGIAALEMRVKAWGVSMDGSAAAAGIQWELVETGTVFATVTASVAADIHGWDAIGKGTTSTTYFAVGTTATGYTGSAEGTITATRMFDSQFIQPTGQYAWEFSLGNEPVVSAVSSLRIRCKAAAAVNAVVWAILEV